MSIESIVWIFKTIGGAQQRAMTKVSGCKIKSMNGLYDSWNYAYIHVHTGNRGYCGKCMFINHGSRDLMPKNQNEFHSKRLCGIQFDCYRDEYCSAGIVV